MSDLSSESDVESSVSESEVSSYSSSEIEEFEEDAICRDSRQHGSHEVDGVEPYADEPIASSEWLRGYHSEQQQLNEQLLELQGRLDNEIPINTWCKCGSCAVNLLVNAKECKCCTEIPKCMDALKDKWVTEEIEEELSCITQHPGFRAVCLERWSLKLAADKYKTLQNKRYTNSGAEKRFLCAVAYREFTRLVHGRLGNKRIPLPACAYQCIRAKFILENEAVTGFEDE